MYHVINIGGGPALNAQCFAKSPLSNGKQPTVQEHLSAVARLSRQYGEEISMAESAELAGYLHDFGKYGGLFQKLLRGEVSRINHAVCGASLLWQMCHGRSGFIPIIESIRGHHYGLVSCEGNAEELNRIISRDEHIELDGKQVAIAGKDEYMSAYRLFENDFPSFRLSKAQMLPRANSESDIVVFNQSNMLTTRMLFSCLVDADYTVSAADEDVDYQERSKIEVGSFLESIGALNKFLEDIRNGSNANAELNKLRNGVFEACGKAGELEPGVFNLTAPTGTGKTLALLHFALRHCAKWGMNRIIVVLPFLSLTEQSTEIYRSIIPGVLEDTSQSELNDTERLFSARWRVPFIVTTSVKFFESLFADSPAGCRRLHNIANSVIIFDEAQSLPPELTRATIRATDELCSRYGCTMVFSTATQPDYSAIDGFLERKPRDILPDYASYYTRLARTEVEWRLDDAVSWERLSEELALKNSVCAIVNLRKHARELYRNLVAKSKNDEVFFLTTDLCPAHRTQIIQQIRARLENHLPCRVVSTQCIEAGVDLDFDAVYRALSPLDSIIQAAGRCNRNGRLPQNGKVAIFIPEDEAYPGTWYQNCAKTVKRLCAEKPIDIHDPTQISRYFHEVFSKLKDKPALCAALRNKNYAETAQAYRMIENRGMQVVVPYIGQLKLYNLVKTEACAHGMTPRLMKLASPITVSCYADDALDSVAENIPYAGKQEDDSTSPFYLLRPQYSQYYLENMGLQIPRNPQAEVMI